jgi:hypothetical protein
MTLERVYAQNPKGAAEYRAMLIADASIYGIDPRAIEGMKRPILVREMKDAEINSQRAITDLNKPPTAALSGAERATADARSMTAETAKHIANVLESVGPDVSLNDVLNTKYGPVLINRLIREGIFTEEERPALIDNSTGTVTKEAKERTAKMLLGDLFADNQQFQRAEPSLRNKLERAVAPLKMTDNIPGWGLGDDVKGAIALLEHERDVKEYDEAHGAKAGGFLAQHQEDMFGGAGERPQVSEPAERIAKFIKDSSQRTVGQAFRSYAADAAKSQEMFAEKTQEQAFDAAFGKKPSGLPAESTGPVTLGSGLGAAQEPFEQLYKQDVAPAIKTVAAGLAHSWDTIKKIVNPVSRGESAKFTGLSMREHMADRQRAYDIAAKAMEPAHKMFDGIAGKALGGDEGSRQYVTSFIDRIERGETDPNPEMNKAGEVFRQILDERRKAVQDVDPNALQNYIENYFPHIWKDPAKAKSVIDQIIMDYMGKRPMEGNTSWKRMRSIPFFEEGIKRGLEPVSWNPVDLVTQRVVQMDKYVMAHRVFNDLDEAGLLKYVPLGEKAPDGYAQIDDRIATVYGPKQGAVKINPEKLDERPARANYETGPEFKDALREWRETNVQPEDVTVFGRREMGKYWAPEPAARVINNHLSPGLRGSELVGPLYRQWIGASNWLNQFQLGFSLFHAGFTSVDAITSKVGLALIQASRGDIGKAARSLAQAPASFLTQPFGIGDKLIKEWERPGSQGDAIGALVEAMKAGGWRAHMDQMYKTRITQNMIEAWRAGNPFGAAMRAPFAAVEQSVRPILEWLVPRQKAAVVADLVRYEMERNPNMTHQELREVAAKAVDSADNRMGQLAYDNLFWNKTLKDLLMASVRSVGWNIGTIRELGGGALDLRKLASSKPELTYRASYIPALILTTGTMGAIMQYAMTGKGPQELKDYFFPRTGRLDEHGNPERVSLPSYMKDIYHYRQEPGKTITNKLHPALNLVAEMLENKDYYGTEIRNADDPLMKQMLDTAKFGAKALEPFSLRGARRQVKLGGSRLGNFAANFVGVTPAPRSINMTPAERLADEYRQTHRDPGARTQENADRSTARSDVIRAMRLGQNPVPLMRQYIQEGKISPHEFAQLRQVARETPLQSSVKNLNLREALNVYDKASDDEKRSLERTVRSKVFLARQKPSEWTGKVPELASRYFGVKPPMQRSQSALDSPTGY